MAALSKGRKEQFCSDLGPWQGISLACMKCMWHSILRLVISSRQIGCIYGRRTARRQFLTYCITVPPDIFDNPNPNNRSLGLKAMSYAINSGVRSANDFGLYPESFVLQTRTARASSFPAISPCLTVTAVWARGLWLSDTLPEFCARCCADCNSASSNSSSFWTLVSATH